jgi:uncharacterized membrane protein
MPDSLYVLAASYENVDDALAAHRAIDAAWHHVSSSYAFDATVLARDADGKVDIVTRHDEPMRHSTTAGLGYGFAFGAVAALFPAVGILGALAVGTGTGAALGAGAGHAARVMSRDDLKALGEVLDRGEAGLVVVYPPDMADRVNAELGGATAKAHAMAGVSGEELAAEVRAAEAKAAAASEA